MVVGLPGGRHRSLRPPVERVQGGNDLVGPVAVQLAVAAGQLHRALHGFGPAVAEEHQVKAAILYQCFGQPELGDGVELVGRLDQGPGLFGNSLGNHRVAVAQLVYRPAGDEVEVLLAVGVPDLGAVASDNDHRLAAYRLRVILLLDINPVAAVTHGETPSESSGRILA